jgi:hypothetical protein
MNSSIFTPELIAIIAMFITMVGAMLGFGFNVTNRLARVETKVDGMDEKFDGIDKKFDKVDEKFDAIDKKFEGIYKKFDKIDADIMDVKDRIGAVVVDVAFLKGNFAAQGASPLELTKRGMQISESIDGEQIIDDNFEMLSEYIKKHSPTDSLFDILVTGRHIIKERINEILSKEHKDTLYAIGADRYLVLDTLSIVLRDKYIQAAIKIA